MNFIPNTNFEINLTDFINKAKESIQLLETSLMEEDGSFYDEDETLIETLVGLYAQNHISYQANMKCVDSLSHLRNAGRTINGVLLE